MKKVLIVLSVLILLAGGGVYFLLPTNINWEKYVQEMSESFRNQTGLTLNITGAPSFSMKPSPVLKLGQIRLGNITGGTYPEMVTAEQVELLFDTGSLFRRKIKIKKITLSSPRFYFETAPDGKWNWQIAFFDRAVADTTGGFDSLLMNDGRAEIRTGKQTAVRQLGHINAEIFAESMRGPFIFEGNFGTGKTSFNFSLKTEKYQIGKTPEISLRLINVLAEATFSFSGKYGLTEADRGMLTGSADFDIRKPEQFFALAYPEEKLPSELFQPSIGNFKLSSVPQTGITELSDFLFKYGTSSATGKLKIHTSVRQNQDTPPPEPEIALAPETEPVPTQEGENAVPLNEEVSVPEEKPAFASSVRNVDGSFVFSKFDADPFFNNISAITAFMAKEKYFTQTKDVYTLQVMFDQVNYKKDIIHQLGGKIEKSENGFLFKKVSATLPGGAYVSGESSLTLGSTPVWVGKVSADVSNTVPVLEWLGITVAEDVPQTLLRQMKAETDFRLYADTVILEKVKGKLDKIDFSGQFSMHGEKRKDISFSADVSDLNFSQYFPKSSKEAVQTREEFARLPAKEKVEKLFKSLSFFNDFDLNAQLATKAFSWADINAKNIKADISVVQGRLKITEMSADNLFASTVSISGELEGFDTTPQFNDVHLNIKSNQVSSLVQALGVSLPRELVAQDKMQLISQITGDLQILNFDTSVDFGSTHFAGKGNLREAGTKMDWSAAVEIRHENFRNFVRLFTDAYRPVLSNPGAMDLSGQILKNGDDFQILDMILRVGENMLNGSVKMKGRGNSQSTQTNESALPVVEADLVSSKFIPLGLLPKMNILENASIDTQGKSSDDVLEKNGFLAAFADTLSFSQKPFDFSFLGAYEANITLRTNELIFNSLLLKDFDSVIKLSPNKIVLDIRRALWKQTNFGGMFNFDVTGSDLGMKAALRFSNVNIPANLFDAVTLDVGGIENLVLNLNLNGSGKTTDAVVSSLNGTGTLNFEKAKLDHFNLNDFQQNMSKAEEPQKEEVLKTIFSGQMEMNRFSADIGFDKGTVSIRPVSFFYNGIENKTPFIVYNYLGKMLKAGISFPSGVPAVPEFTVSIAKTGKKQALLTQNAAKILETVLSEKKQEKEKIEKENELKRQKEQEEREKFQRQQMMRLVEVEKNIMLALSSLMEKDRTVRPMIDKVYQVERYLSDLKNVMDEVQKENFEIRTRKEEAEKGKDLTAEEVDAFEEAFKKGYSDKEEEINTGFKAVMLADSKSTILVVAKEAGEVLRDATRDQKIHLELPEIAQDVEEMKEMVKRIKELHTESEKEGLKQEDVTILVGQADAELENIKATYQKIQGRINKEKERLDAIQKEKREAEERRKKEEELRIQEEERRKREDEEAKKREEEEAVKEKERREAEERERQRKIIRKDGIKPTSSAIKKESSDAVLKLRKKEETVEAKQPEEKNNEEPKVKKDSSVIIRRR